MKKVLTLLLLMIYSFSIHASEKDDIDIKTHIESLHGQVDALMQNSQKIHHIGERYHGGIIFWVDERGEHGLVATLEDITTEGIQWRNGDSGSKITNASANGIGAGESNTNIIIAEQTIDKQPGRFAALLAHSYSILDDGATPCFSSSEMNCYSAWYLPSAFELELLRVNLTQIGQSSFMHDYYWSSTEASTRTAYMLNVADGSMTATDKATAIGHVRPIARF